MTNDKQFYRIYQLIRQSTAQHRRLIAQSPCTWNRLLVERLGVGGGGSDVGITGGLVGAGGLLEGLGSREVGVTGRGVGGRVAVQVAVHVGLKSGKHC